ncbi:uncharacterized protein VTP21DRAFT_6088 [Calcarisporiella thermophila]|uniref:uncharacterized protein n=1 Tax=Calcarisporiella thermophila TaxID=911321 RepID=UPI00374451AF
MQSWPIDPLHELWNATAEQLQTILRSESQSKNIKVIALVRLEKLIREPHINCIDVLPDILAQVDSKSTKLQCQAFRILLTIFRTRKIALGGKLPDNLSRLSELCSIVTAKLSNSHHRTRSLCLQLLVAIPMQLRTLNQDQESIFVTDAKLQTIVSKYGQDSDPRVRKVALNSLLSLHLRGCNLDLSLYPLAVSALKDDYEDVRVSALDLIWVLGNLFQEHKLNVEHGGMSEEIRMVDDVFVKICDMVNDGTAKVRSKACNLLGTFRQVNIKFLSQTFSKQIISHLRRKVPMGRSKGSKKLIPVAEGDFDVESDEFRLLDSGACGAFVHGLEDEYQDVRLASIDSICELSMYNKEFAIQSVDFLVDMFNDEIDEVRLDSINSLRKVSTKSPIILDTDQLQIALGVLEDASRRIREGAHEMLRVSNFASAECMPIFIEALQANLVRYPGDQLSIYRCLRDIGARHSEFVEPLVAKLLKLDPIFAPREQNVEDPTYVGYLILILNAAEDNKDIQSQLPKYVRRHYTYLRDKFPGCFPPQLRAESKSGLLIVEARETPVIENHGDVEDLLKHTMATVSKIVKLVQQREWNVASRFIAASNENLKYIGTLNPILSGKAEFVILYLQCCKILIEAKSRREQFRFGRSSLETASQLLRISYSMEHSFLGLPRQARSLIDHFKLVAHILWVFGSILENKGLTNGEKSLLDSLQTLQDRINDINKKSRDTGVGCEKITRLGDHLSTCMQVENNAIKLAKSSELLFAYVLDYIPGELDIDNLLKKTRGTLISPKSNPDKPVEFVSAFSLRAQIEAEIQHITSIRSIAIKATFLDQSTRLYWPPVSHFCPTTPYHYTLETSIEIEQAAWTDKCYVTLELVYVFEPEELDQAAIDDILAYPHKPSCTSPTTVPIGDPVQFYILPRRLNPG